MTALPFIYRGLVFWMRLKKNNLNTLIFSIFVKLFSNISMMKNSVFLFFVFLVLFPSIALAQEYKPLRAEFSSKEFDQIRLIPASPNRVIVFKHYTKHNNRGDVWQVNGLDERLNKIWTKDIMIPRSYQLNEYEICNDSILHLLVVKNKGENASFLKLRMNIINGSFSSHLFKGNRKSLLVGLKMYNGKLFLYGLGLENIQEQLNKYNAETKYEKIVTTKIPSEYHIITALADTAHNRFVILVKNTKSTNGELRLLEFDKQGEVTAANLLSSSSKHNIINGNLVYSEDSELLFIGTYNNSFSKSKRKTDNNAYGVFMGQISNNRFDFFQFYRFSDFENIYKTLSYREQQKLKTMTAKGKQVELSFKLLMHNKILKQNGQHVLVLESYYPVYHYESMYDARGYMYQTEVFDGYKTTYAVAIGFDNNGELLWDNYIQVKGVQNFYLDQSVTVYTDENTQVFMYYLNEKVYSKVNRKNETIYKREATELPTVMSGEQVLLEENGRITHWHNSYFLISGYQKILDKRGKNRKVYFVMGISFE